MKKKDANESVVRPVKRTNLRFKVLSASSDSSSQNYALKSREYGPLFDRSGVAVYRNLCLLYVYRNSLLSSSQTSYSPVSLSRNHSDRYTERSDDMQLPGINRWSTIFSWPGGAALKCRFRLTMVSTHSQVQTKLLR
jgi:hypothetical protein